MQTQYINHQNKLDQEIFTEINISELELFVGGGFWDDLKDDLEYGYNKVAGGVKSTGKGLKDGSSDSSSRADDLWYNLGYTGGQYLDSSDV